jgi:hypothetical protein
MRRLAPAFARALVAVIPLEVPKRSLVIMVGPARPWEDNWRS